MPLAEAAGALGRLDPTLAAITPQAADGAVTRLALADTEAMLWAGGIVLPREEIGRDALDARAASDPEAMRLARWTLRRLGRQGALSDLPGFLGLHRPTGAVAGSEPGPVSGAAARLRGPDFERGAASHLAAVAGGARAGRDEIRRLEAWAEEARRATSGIRGQNAGRVIALLAARPLVSAEDVARGASISRMTAERMLNRLTEMGVIREITGASRFRLWRANPAGG